MIEKKEYKSIRVSDAIRIFNISLSTLKDCLRGTIINGSITLSTKLSYEQFLKLTCAFQNDRALMLTSRKQIKRKNPRRKANVACQDIESRIDSEIELPDYKPFSRGKSKKHYSGGTTEHRYQRYDKIYASKYIKIIYTKM